MQAILEKPKALGTKSLCTVLHKMQAGQVCISYLALIKCTTIERQVQLATKRTLNLSLNSHKVN